MATPHDRAAARRRRRADVLQRPPAHRFAGFERRASQVRQQHDVLHLQQLGGHGRFPLVDVDARRGDLPALQRGHERRLVDDVAARRVDQDARFLHLAEPLRVHQVTRLGQRRAVQRDEVRLPENCLERGARLRAERRRRHERIVEDDRHPEAVVRLLRHRPRDPAEADEPERLPAHHRSHHVRRPPAGPLAVAHVALAFARASRGHEQQRHREIGRRFGQHVRGIGDRHARRLSPRRCRCC